MKHGAVQDVSIVRKLRTSEGEMAKTCTACGKEIDDILFHYKEHHPEMYNCIEIELEESGWILR